nr:zinc finger AN1 and C2H2 domain-containing stress-associated protein 16-like [Ipomoea batatas]GME15057.1 zinc finger AN1 and C2H2 domain-containing stress-associated protein 16-like [Ipomoea batatas]
MGTPAFPNLGKHCSVDDCRQIDFLPFTCDCCHKVFCLEHRSYARHQCPKGNKHDVTVVICPLCAKGVRLIPDEDPNITWQSHHRFGPDHNCPGPKKPEPAFQFLGFLSRKEEPKKAAPAPSSSRWTTSLLNAATSGIAKLSSEFNQALQIGGDGGGQGQSSVSKQQVEQCPLCNLKFSTGAALVDHVQKVHEKKGVMNVSIDVCPRCSKGFRDPVSLVEHVERDHGGTSKA